MPDVPVEEGRRLLAEATSGEWHVDDFDLGRVLVGDGTQRHYGFEAEYDWPEARADAALIVFLRNHAGALLEAAERAEAAKTERDQAWNHCSTCGEMSGGGAYGCEECSEFLSETELVEKAEIAEKAEAALAEASARAEDAEAKLTCGGVNCGECWDCLKVNWHFGKEAFDNCKARLEAAEAALAEAAERAEAATNAAMAERLRARAAEAEVATLDAKIIDLTRVKDNLQAALAEAAEQTQRYKDAIQACIGDVEGQEAVAPGSRKPLTLTNGQARLLAAALAGDAE